MEARIKVEKAGWEKEMERISLESGEIGMAILVVKVEIRIGIRVKMGGTKRAKEEKEVDILVARAMGRPTT